MTSPATPRLHHATGLGDYDAAAWTHLPPVRGVLRGRAGWGVLLQEPEAGPLGPRPVEVDVPDTRGVVLMLALAAGRNEARFAGVGAARPMRVELRRGDAVLVPPGIASRWHSSTGQERVLHMHLSLGFLDAVAAQGDGQSRPDLLRPGTLRRDATLDILLRHVVRQLREQEAGWRIAIDSALTLVAAQLLAGLPLRRRQRGHAAAGRGAAPPLPADAALALRGA